MPLPRNSCASGEFLLQKVGDHSICGLFDCGNDDLNEYFRIDSIPHRAEYLTQSYCLLYSGSRELLALLDFCNDSVKLKDYVEFVRLDQSKQHSSLPAVKLTRFGVRKDLQGLHIGTYIMNMVKAFFVSDNRTGCRFLTVDAYPDVVGFYQKNGFFLMTQTDKRKQTRAMAFDLKRFTPTGFDFSVG